MGILNDSVHPAELSWMEEYRNRKAYSHLSDEQLRLRYAALLENTVAFDQSGTAFIDRPTAPYWTKRLVWAEEEFRQRRAWDAVVSLQTRELERPRPLLAAARRLWSTIEQPAHGPYIVKFGKAAHIEQMYSKGCFRISSASSYAESQNAAIRDQELASNVVLPPRMKLTMEIDGTQQEIPNLIRPICLTRQCKNFYVFCASSTFRPRLFDDFDADACLLVRDLSRFTIRLWREMATRSRQTDGLMGPVHYEDPLHPIGAGRSVEMTKDFRYEYQSEWRMTWSAEVPLSPDAEPVTIEIGSLRESCEAYYL